MAVKSCRCSGVSLEGLPIPPHDTPWSHRWLWYTLQLHRRAYAMYCFKIHIGVIVVSAGCASFYPVVRQQRSEACHHNEH